MHVINYNDLITNFNSVLDEVIINHKPVILKKHKKDNVVIISYKDYSSIVETAYLLNSPKNAQHLFESIKSFKEGKGQVRELIED